MRTATQELRNRLLQDAAQQVAGNGLRAARAALNFTQLAEDASVPRPYLHELLGNSNKALRAVADFIFDPDLVASGANENLDAMLSLLARLPPDTPTAEAMRLLFELLFARQLNNPVVLASWVLHAGCLRYAPAFASALPADGDEAAADTARSILRARSAFYEAMDQRFVGLVTAAVAATGRRLQPEVHAEELVLILHALLDGLALRAALHPDEVTPEFASRALYKVAEAYTESTVATAGGGQDDWQELAAAKIAAGFRKDGSVPSTHAIARACRTKAAVVDAALPSAEARMLHAARSIVMQILSGLRLGDIYPLEVLRRPLLAALDAVQENERLFAALGDASRTALEEEASERLRAVIEMGVTQRRLACPAPAETSTAMARLLFSGDSGREAIIALLGLMRPSGYS